MSRIWTLVGIAVVTLGFKTPAPIDATTDAAKGGEVRALSIVPASGRAEVVIAVDGSVDVSDFALASPARIILDLKGAKFTGSSRLYDKVPRGGITNVRIAQYREDVVRVVIELDGDHKYTLKRGADDVRLTIDGVATGTFVAWATTPSIAAAPAADYAAGGSDRILSGHANVKAARQSAFVSSSSQPRITVTYVDADIRDVIAAFALFSGRTIVVGKGVTGTVTAEVRDQPWDVALRAILQSQGLAAKEDADGIITVDSFDNLGKQQASEPLTTQMISLNYARAASLLPSVKGLLSKECAGLGYGGANAGTVQNSPGYGNSGCTSRGDVSFDSASNRLIVTDVGSRLLDMINYIRDLDVRTPQVAIKAKIIEVNRTSIQDIGVSYDLGTANTFFNKLVQRPDPSTFQPVDSNGDGVPDGVSGKGYPTNQTVVDIGGNSLAMITNANQRVVNPALQLLFTTTIGKFNLTAFIDALQETRLADVQAEPSVVTLDNKKAEIMSGQEIPIRIVDVGSLTTGGAVATAPRSTVAYKETGIILTVTPHITNNRQVLLIVHAERSVVTPASADLGYVIDKQRADNEVLVGDGETAVIGGLTDSHVLQDKTGIPILIDLPFIGKLFGETRTEETKNDLIILITPHIVDEGEALGPPGTTP
jgi:type IV pilus assembly protein PilQ